MKLQSLLIATAFAVTISGAAFAQSGAGIGNGDAAAKHEDMKKDSMKDSKGMATKSTESTTGSGALKSKDNDVAASPGSTNAGIKQEK